ncbi:MAG: tetratricopeptide repeat protein [Bacteroidota bacterium]
MKNIENRMVLKVCAALLLSVLLSCSTPRPTERAETSDFKTSGQDTAQFSQKARKYFVQGSVLEMQQRYAEAIVEYQQALRYDSSAVIFYALAKNYLDLSKVSQTPKLDQALEYAKAATERDPEFIPALDILANVYATQYKFDEAIPPYETIVRLQPTRQNRFTLARLYEYKDMNKAIAAYEDLAREEEDYNVLFRLTEIYRQQGRQDDLTRTLLKMLLLAPDNPAVGETIFQNYLNQKNFLKAQELFTTFEKELTAEQMTRYYALYGAALIAVGDSLPERQNLAETYFLKVQSLTDPDWRTLLTAGFLADAVKNETKADNFFTKALTASDTIADVPVQIALNYIQSERFQKAIDVLKKAEPNFLKDWRFPFFQGISHARLDQDDAAITNLLKAAAIDSSIADTWIQLGLLYDGKLLHEKSDAAYEKALTLDPLNALANNNYAYALSERGLQLERALKMIKIAYAAEPKNASYLDTYGWILFKMGNYEKALGFIQQAIDNGDVSAAVFEHLGDVYEKLNDREKAREAWERSLQKDPQRTSAQQRLNSIR